MQFRTLTAVGMLDSCPNSVVESFRSTGIILGQPAKYGTFQADKRLMPWRILVQLSEYFLGRLRGDREFTFYQAHAKQIDLPSVLAPDSIRPSTDTFEKIDHDAH